MKLIDVHSHYLYGLDDGAKSPEMTLNMFRMAYADGVRGIICTPHFNPKYWHKDVDDIKKRFAEVKKLLGELDIPDLKLWLGSEVFYHKIGMHEMFEEGHVPTMAGGRYVLIEFHYDAEFSQIRDAVNDIIAQGFIPIIAHIERFDALRKDISNVYTLKDMGAMLQVNAGTVLGKKGFRAKHFTFKLLKDETVDIIATDAHRDEGGRAPNLGAAYEYLSKKCTAAYVRKLFRENPEMIIESNID